MAFDELVYAVEYWLPREACREGYKYYDNSIGNCTIKFNAKIIELFSLTRKQLYARQNNVIDKDKTSHSQANTLPDCANNQLPGFGQVWLSVFLYQTGHTR